LRSTLSFPCRAGWICQFDHTAEFVWDGDKGTARSWGRWQSRWLAADGFAVCGTRVLT
jgi:hypothetical protein